MFKRFYIPMILLCMLSAGCRSAQSGNEAAREGVVTVAVFSINDFHASFVPDARKGIPGAAAVWQTLDSLKAVYPYHLTLSAGDNFGGSYFYKATKGCVMPVFFNGLGIRISALGNHEFDDGQAALADKWQSTGMRPEGWNIDYVCANVRTAEGSTPAYAQPWTMEEIAIGNKKLTVGIVGLLTSSTPKQTSRSRIAGLTFDGRYPQVLDSLKALPDFPVGKADIRLLLTHIGTGMQQGTPVWVDEDSAHAAALRDPMWHAFISSHTHQTVCGEINDGLPVVQGLCMGTKISMLKFEVDTARMQVLSVTPELCPVRPDVALSGEAKAFSVTIDSLLNHTLVMGGQPLCKQLTTATAEMTHNRDDKYRMSEVGTLVCEAYAAAYRRAVPASHNEVVIGASHYGSIRAGILQGPVRVLDVGEVLPFSNVLKVYKLTGKQLRALVEFGLHNKQYGWLQTSGLEVECDKAETLHVKSLWHTAPSGRRIRLLPDASYILVVDDFITTGGDGYLPELFPAAQELKIVSLPTTTEAFVQHLMNQQTIGGKAEAERKIVIGEHKYASWAEMQP